MENLIFFEEIKPWPKTTTRISNETLLSRKSEGSAIFSRVLAALMKDLHNSVQFGFTPKVKNIIRGGLTWSGQETVSGLLGDEGRVARGHDRGLGVAVVSGNVGSIANLVVDVVLLVLGYLFHEVQHLEQKSATISI